MSNKGVSGIIATILLVMITIGLVDTAYIYFSGMVGGRTAKTISISDVSCNSTGYITVVVSNDGTKDISDSDLTVLVDNVDRSDNYAFGTISSHTAATVVSAVPESLGTEHIILITSPSNSGRQVVTC